MINALVVEPVKQNHLTLIYVVNVGVGSDETDERGCMLDVCG